jgi:hypothetical protein
MERFINKFSKKNSILDSCSNTGEINSKTRPLQVDTQIHLYEDPLFNALVIADFLRFQELVDLDLSEPYETYNRILSLVGHFSNGDIHGAAKFLFSNYKNLREKYNLGLPRRIETPDTLLDEVKSPFANVTAYDIAKVLSGYGLIEAKPEEIFGFAQSMINEYRLWLLDSFNGKARTKLVDSRGNPLFGLKAVQDIEFRSEKEYDAFWIGTAWALAVMDNFSYRARTGPDIGGGICVPINLEKMINAPLEMMHDLKTLSSLDTIEFLSLPTETPLPVVEEIFNQTILQDLIKSGIIVQGKAKQGKDVTAGYVRIKRGPGTADFMSIGFGWLTKGKFGSLGVLLGDAEDTAQVLARDIYFGGQDEMLFNEFMKHPRFKETVEPYLQPEWTNALIRWSYEDPTVGFPIASCSQSYQSRLNYDEDDTFTTLRKETWFFEHFKRQFDSGSVARDIPRWPVGFERTPSRQYLDYILKKAHYFRNIAIFPERSWIYDHLS